MSNENAAGVQEQTYLGPDGSRMGQTAEDKIAFYDATPAVQPLSTGQTAGFTAGSGTAVLDDSIFTGGTGSIAYTIGDVVKHLKALGLLDS